MSPSLRSSGALSSFTARSSELGPRALILSSWTGCTDTLSPSGLSKIRLYSGEVCHLLFATLWLLSFVGVVAHVSFFRLQRLLDILVHQRG